MRLQQWAFTSRIYGFGTQKKQGNFVQNADVIGKTGMFIMKANVWARESITNAAYTTSCGVASLMGEIRTGLIKKEVLWTH